ncbi:hypothetical protein D3C78_1454100 [compost metagenome]
MTTTKRCGNSCCAFSSGVIISPIPATQAFRPRKKKGTSAPSVRPMASSAGRGRSSPQRRFRASKVVAASDEPPPMPAWAGMLLSTPMCAPALQPVAVCRARAARTIKSLSGRRMPLRSWRVICPSLRRSKCRRSCQSISMKTDSIRW